MFEDIWFFLIVLFVCIVLRNIFVNTHGIIFRIYCNLRFIGTICHEIAHATLCILTGVKVKKISVNYKEGGGFVSHGKCSFLQQEIIATAPLIFSSYLAYLCLHILLLVLLP